MKHLTTFAATLAMFAAATTTTLACAFHSYMPDETVVDKMLASEHIVLARQDPDNPFRYVAIEAIRGSTAQVDLPQLVDSVTRRRLAANPSDTVLFAREGSYGPWQRLAYLDASYRGVVDTVATRLEDWQYGGDEERYQLSADLLDHRNPDLKLLALRELDRAPYGLLRELHMDPDAKRILSAIRRPDMIEFMPIHVLLMGLSGDPEATPALERGLDAAITAQSLGMIGAWATAVIEHTGINGVDQIATRLRTDTVLEPDTRESLIEALAIHAGVGDPEIRDRIDLTLQSLLSQDATYASMIARQLGSRGNWSQADGLGQLLTSGALTSAEALISVTHYLKFAKTSEQAPAGN